LNNPPTHDFGDESNGMGGMHPLQPLIDHMNGAGGGGFNANNLSNVLRGQYNNSSVLTLFSTYKSLIQGLNQNEFASLLSSFGGSNSGSAGLMQGTLS
jgi:hypothetical protein